MDIGIALLMTQHDFNTIDLARLVEDVGFESLWAPEHGIIPVDFKVDPPLGQQGGVPRFYTEGGINHIVDPLIFLAGAATVTKKIKLGTGICLVPERNPIRLAKEVATLDQISGGRFLFGVGAGWLRGESEDRKSTRLNSRHKPSSYAGFCLKKKNLLCLTTTTKHNYRHEQPSLAT